jgi:uncharacterized RDD family membrane protein YckC
VGGTPGQRVLGLEIVRHVDGVRAGPLRLLARAVLVAVGLIPLGLGHVASWFTRERRGLHDLLTGTVVVRRGQAQTRARDASDG